MKDNVPVARMMNATTRTDQPKGRCWSNCLNAMGYITPPVTQSQNLAGVELGINEDADLPRPLPLAAIPFATAFRFWKYCGIIATHGR